MKKLMGQDWMNHHYGRIDREQLGDMMANMDKEQERKIKDLEGKEKKGRLDRWRERLNTGISEVSKWLKDREAGAFPGIVDAEGQLALLRGQAVDMIQRHWKKVWDRLGEGNERRTRLDAAKALVKSALEKAKRRRFHP